MASASSKPAPYRMERVVEDAAQRRQLLDERAEAHRQRQPQDRGEQIGLGVDRKPSRDRLGLLVARIAAAGRDDGRDRVAAHRHQLLGLDLLPGHQHAQFGEAAEQVRDALGRDAVHGDGRALHVDGFDPGRDIDQANHGSSFCDWNGRY